MSPEQIPLVVSWIAAINTAGEIDQIDIADKMEREMRECIAAGICEYFIGYFQQMATFYLVGALADSDDYEVITLLPSPVVTEDLYLHLFHQAIKFVFEKKATARVVFQVDVENALRQSILIQLGFCEVASPGDGSQLWLGCSRPGFLGG